MGCDILFFGKQPDRVLQSEFISFAEDLPDVIRKWDYQGEGLDNYNRNEKTRSSIISFENKAPRKLILSNERIFDIKINESTPQWANSYSTRKGKGRFETTEMKKDTFTGICVNGIDFCFDNDRDGVLCEVFFLPEEKRYLDESEYGPNRHYCLNDISQETFDLLMEQGAISSVGFETRTDTLQMSLYVLLSLVKARFVPDFHIIADYRNYQWVDNILDEKGILKVFSTKPLEQIIEVFADVVFDIQKIAMN
ncbi:MAG TPA: hypothetical protein PLN69_06570 [bacterium]|nr:hypothetical protein [bacterium]